MLFSLCRQHPADRRTVPAVRWYFPDQRSAIYSAYTHEKINLISATTFLWPCVMFYPLKIKFALEFAVLQQKQDVAVGHFFFVYIIITAFLNNKRSHGKRWGYVSIVTFVSWSRLIAIVSRPSNVLKFVPQFIPNGAFYFLGNGLGIVLKVSDNLRRGFAASFCCSPQCPFLHDLLSLD